MNNYPRVGIVLSSGGVRGVYAHTGFLLSLQELDISVTAIAGCSAGAIVGGMFASGTNMQSWVDTLSILKHQQFWAPSWSRLLWSLLVHRGRGYTGLSSTKPAMEFCAAHLQVATFEECRIPFYTLANNLISGEKTVFSEGTLVPRIVASAASPLLYQPVEIDGQYYCDGALLELAPTDAICCKHNLDILIIHHVAQRNNGQAGFQQVMKRPWSMVTILNMLLYQKRPWYLSDKPLTFRRCPCGCRAVIVVIEPDLPELLWPVTDSGMQMLDEAKNQTSNLLHSCSDELKHDASMLMDRIEKTEMEESLPAVEPERCNSRDN